MSTESPTGTDHAARAALYAIIARVMAVDADGITPELGPEDVERWDSLGQLELIVALEKHYDLSFEIEEVFEIFTVGDIERLLAAKGALG